MKRNLLGAEGKSLEGRGEEGYYRPRELYEEKNGVSGDL